jgi:hypothetical protein
MATNAPLDPATVRAESIALLYLLHSVPVQPSRNSVKILPISDGRYSLPFEIERSLASTLAFLSSTTDDPNYIPAVSLEEDPSSKTLKVLLAVNKVKQNDGKQVLQRIQNGFEHMFAALSRLLKGQ